MTGVPPSPTLRAGWRWFRWRSLILVLVFACGYLAFLTGVGVSDRDGVDAADALTKLYYTLGLFVLAGLDIGMPTGGPEWARGLLWVAYFGAPAITASALVEGALKAINPDGWRLARMRNHTVIVGCGRLALLYLGRFRELNPHAPVLVVESNGSRPEVAQAKRRFGAQVVIGDIRSDVLLDTLRLRRARRLLLLTGDDFANLDVASRAAELAPRLAENLVVHVADMRMMHVIQDAPILTGATIFNSHAVAAKHLVETRIQAHFRETEPRDTIILAGFGRFGQTVLTTLQRLCAGTFSKVIIADLEAEARAVSFADQVGFGDDYERLVLDGDLRDPRVWKRIEGTVEGVERPVFVVGSGDDGLNVRTALRLSTAHPKALIVARCFRDTSFTRHVSRQCAFDIVAVSNLLLRSMPDAWFD